MLKQELAKYTEAFNAYFSSPEALRQMDDALAMISKAKRIFFLGNGGSNSISSHMMEDYAKMAGKQTFAFSDAAMITCYANDFGYERAMAEWLKVHFTAGDLLIAISSSGKSMNILNAVKAAKSLNGKVISLSGFKKDNPLSLQGDINFHIPLENYGIVECYHQVILHVLLDSLNQ